MMYQDEILNLLFKVIPNPEHISSIDLSCQPTVGFKYRDGLFRISENLSVDECRENVLCRTIAAIFLEQLLKNRRKDYAD